MKAILILAVSLLYVRGCTNNQSKNSQSSAMIEYEYYSRGGYRKIIVSNQLLVVYDKQGAEKPSAEKPLSNLVWQTLVKQVTALNLDAIATYKDPTQKRFYDGAPIAVFTIKNQGKEYKTNAFDHGDPPIEIKELVNKINELAAQ